MPFSVIMPAISSCGVTSNPGFIMLTPSAHVRFPLICVTSSCERSSIGISFPDFIEISIVDLVERLSKLENIDDDLNKNIINFKERFYIIRIYF